MPRAISEDLRKRVVAMRRSGCSVEEVAAHFQVSRDSVYRWDALDRQTGSLSSGYARCGRTSSIDEEKFRGFVKQHAHATLRQMQAHWEGEVSLMALSRMLRKIGWTHKKSTTPTANATRRSVKPS
jgi:transposase